MWRVLRYRPLQALALLGLSALVTACAVFAPLQDRAIKQESAAARIAPSSVQLTGVGLSSRSGSGDPALTPDQLAALVPHRIRPSLAVGVPGGSVAVATPPGGYGSSAGTVRWRAHACAHVRFVAGRCPRAYDEIAISTADARLHHWGPGTRVPVLEAIADPSLAKANPQPPTATLRVVGVYTQPPSAYWFGADATGRSGTVDREVGQIQDDDWLAARETLDGTAATKWVGLAYTADLPLRRDRVGIDQLLRLGPEVARFVATPVPTHDGSTYVAPGSTPIVLAYSGLPDLAASAARDVGQVGTTVPLLVAQLGLLAAVVLWLFLGAALDQRRPDLAVARLRGRGVGGARSLVLRELLSVVLAGVPVGCLLAVVASIWARAAWLPFATPFELRQATLVALLVAVAGLVLITVAAVQRVVREPVQSLLRRVPARRTGWPIGLLEAIIVVLSVAAVAGLASGDLRGPAVVAAPTLLALATGIALGHLLVPAGAAAGRWLLARGRLAPGVALLQVARGPSTRRVVAVLTVATALLVFSTDALVVGGRNRADAAEQQLGARSVGTVQGTDLRAVRAALDAVDPTGRAATPVTLASPPGEGGATTVGVVPSQFRRIALLPDTPGDEAAWRRLRPPPAPPLDLTGSRVRLTLRGRPDAGTAGGAGSASGERPILRLRLVPADGAATLVPVARLRPGTFQVTSSVPCTNGCRLTGLSVAAPAATRASGTLSLSASFPGGGPGDLLGPASHWVSPRGTDDTIRPVAGSPTNTLEVAYDVAAAPVVVMRHASVPSRLPSLTTGRLPVDARGQDFSGLDLQGISLPMTRVATLSRVPGAPRDTDVVDLDALAGVAGAGGLTTVQVWFARSDAAVVARVRQALHDRGVVLGRTTTLASVRRTYDETAPAWSLQLALLVGGAGLLIGSLVLLAVAATTWRVRSRDLAALRISGVPSRSLAAVAVTVELVPVAAAVVAGGVCGVVGAHLALPRVPLFASAPEVSTLDLGTAWGAVLVALLVAAVVLLGLGVAAAAWLLRRTGLQRLRESA